NDSRKYVFVLGATRERLVGVFLTADETNKFVSLAEFRTSSVDMRSGYCCSCLQFFFEFSATSFVFAHDSAVDSDNGKRAFGYNNGAENKPSQRLADQVFAAAATAK